MIHDDSTTFAEDLKTAVLTNKTMILAMGYVLDELTDRLDVEEDELEDAVDESLQAALDDIYEMMPEEAEQVNLQEKLGHEKGD
jgi:hypothetical protein